MKREYFCVSDKVDVSGTTFNTVFFLVHWILLVSSLCSSELATFYFYLVGVPFFIYLLFCMTTYHHLQELCFYCKFAILHNGVSLLLLGMFYVEQVPRLYLWGCAIVFGVVVTVTAIARRELRKERETLREKKRRAAMGMEELDSKLD